MINPPTTKTERRHEFVDNEGTCDYYAPDALGVITKQSRPCGLPRSADIHVSDRTKLIREQQRSGSQDVTAVMVSDIRPPRRREMKYDSLEYIRNAYRVPAFKNRIVKVGEKYGIITGASGPHVAIQLSEEKHSRPYHPKHEGLDYLDTEQGTTNHSSPSAPVAGVEGKASE